MPSVSRILGYFASWYVPVALVNLVGSWIWPSFFNPSHNSYGEMMLASVAVAGFFTVLWLFVQWVMRPRPRPFPYERPLSEWWRPPHFD